MSTAASSKRIMSQSIFDRKTSSGAIMRNMSILGLGTAGAQIVNFAAVPIITRIYSPADIGVLAIFSVFLALMSPFVTMRYSEAIPLPSRVGTAANLFALSMIVTFVFAVFFSILLWFFGTSFFALFSASQLTSFGWLLILGIIGIGLYETLSSWAIREKQFQVLAKTKMTQSVFGALIKVGFGILGLKPVGLLVGSIVSHAAGVTAIASQTRESLSYGLSKVKLKIILFLARRYVDFPRFRIPSRLLLALINQAPLIAMALYFDTDVVGQLGLAFMVISVPSTLIISSAGQSCYADFAKIGKNDSHKIYEITKNISLKMFFIGLLPCAILLLFSPSLFYFIFGANWVDAGRFSSILSILLLFRFFISPTASSMMVLEKQKFLFFMNLIVLLITLAVFGLPFVISLDPFGLMKIYVGVMSAQSLVYYLVMLNVIKNFDKKNTTR